MENVRILLKDTRKIPCSVCKKDCHNTGWHLANGNFCSIRCMSWFVENINLILSDMEQRIKDMEKKINEIEKKWEVEYGRRREKFKPSK